MPNELGEAIRQCPILAIVRGPAGIDLPQTVLALSRAGIVAIELSLSSPSALSAFSQIDGFIGENIVLGIGTVRTPREAEAALDKGARFIVTPFLSQEVISICEQRDRPCILGAFSPTEIWNAAELGASAVKVFPAARLGPEYMSDLLAPMPDLRLMPTGGINRANANLYLAAGAWALGVSSGILNKDAALQGQWGRVTDEAFDFVRAVEAIGS